jgi:hypothetical protein
VRETLQLKTDGDRFRARMALARPLDSFLSADHSSIKMEQRLRGVALFGAIGTLALLYTVFVDPCIWATNPRTGLNTVCRELPYAEQVLSGNLIPPLIFLSFAAISAGLPGLQLLLEKLMGGSKALELVVTPEEVVAVVGNDVVFEARRADTKLVVEQTTLVLIRRSDETMMEWRTQCGPLALRRLVDAMGGDAAVL